MNARARILVRAMSLPLVVGLAGCGLGTAGVVAASTGGEEGDPPPAITEFELGDARVAPTPITLKANQSLVVELWFLKPGAAGLQPLTLLSGTGVQDNAVPLPISDLMWDFSDDLGSGYTETVALFVQRPEGETISGGSLLRGVGNDPPVIESIVPLTVDGLPFTNDDDEAAGNVEVELSLSDTSEDEVTLLVQWRRSSDPPDDWKNATVAGIPSKVGTPSSFSFFWKTKNDLKGEDGEFLLRVEAKDGVEPGCRISSAFRVDNNEKPIVELLDTVPVLDERRGIPIPYRVSDEEPDSVRVVFQWRREGQAFPSLPADRATVEAILQDPEMSRRKQICTPYPS